MFHTPSEFEQKCVAVGFITVVVLGGWKLAEIIAYLVSHIHWN